MPAYIVPVTATVTALAATTYVRDLARSREFYGLLGFTEQRSGSNDVSAWAYLRHGGHFLLLASSDPPLPVPALPLLFYFFFDDVDAAVRRLTDAGVASQHVGYPPHALGGEVKVLDPDGNTILLGQPQLSPGQTRPATADTPAEQFSLLREAARLVAHLGDDRACEVGNPGNQPCPQPAQVKLADGWGDTAWACLPHAEDVLIQASGTFVANPDGKGLRTFLDRRHQS